MNTDQNLSKGQKKHDTVVLTIKEKPIFQNTFEVNVSKMSKSPKHMKSKSFLIEKNDSPNKKKIVLIIFEFLYKLRSIKA